MATTKQENDEKNKICKDSSTISILEGARVDSGAIIKIEDVEADSKESITAQKKAFARYCKKLDM